MDFAPQTPQTPPRPARVPTLPPAPRKLSNWETESCNHAEDLLFDAIETATNSIRMRDHTYCANLLCDAARTMAPSIASGSADGFRRRDIMLEALELINPALDTWHIRGMPWSEQSLAIVEWSDELRRTIREDFKCAKILMHNSSS